MMTLETASNRRVILRISGRFEFNNRTEFHETIDLAIKEKPSHIFLDMSDVTFIDSAALALLFKAAEMCQEHQAVLSIANPQQFVLNIMQLTKLSTMIPIVDSLEAVHPSSVLR